MPQLPDETPEQHRERIVNNTNKNSRNELIIAINDAETMNTNSPKTDFNQTYFYGTNEHKNPMKTMDFYVPHLTNEEKIIEQIWAKEGIKQMLPMLTFFGKNAFKNGVFVYSPVLKKRILVGNFETVKDTMMFHINDTWGKFRDDKINASQRNDDWLAQEVAILNSQAKYTHFYVSKANDLSKNKEAKQKLHDDIEKLKNEGILNDVPLTHFPNTAHKSFGDVNQRQEQRIGSGTSYPRPLSMTPEQLLARRNVAINNQNQNIATISNFQSQTRPSSGRINNIDRVGSGRRQN